MKTALWTGFSIRCRSTHCYHLPLCVCWTFFFLSSFLSSFHHNELFIILIFFLALRILWGRQTNNWMCTNDEWYISSLLRSQNSYFQSVEPVLTHNKMLWNTVAQGRANEKKKILLWIHEVKKFNHRSKNISWWWWGLG